MAINIFKDIYYFITEKLHNEKKIYKINIKNNDRLWKINVIAILLITILELLFIKFKHDPGDIKWLIHLLAVYYILKLAKEIAKLIISIFYTELRVVKYINRKLIHFIKINNFIDVVTSKEGVEKILYSPFIMFQLLHDKLIVSFRLDGTKMSNHYCKLEKQLQGTLLLKCIKVDEDVGWCHYIFRRGEIDQIKVNDIINNKIIQYKNDSIDINNDLKWNFRKSPHALIVGITGGGKTFFLAYIIRMFLSYKADVNIIDPKRSDMSYLEKFLGKKVVYENSDIVELMEKTLKEMDNRYDEFRNRSDYGFGKDFFDYGYQPKIIIFDEAMSFFGGSAKKEDKNRVNDCMLDIIAKGRQAGVLIIITAQRADTEFIKGSVRDQLGMRVALGNVTSDGYKMAFGSGHNLKFNSTKKGAGFIFIDGVTEYPIEFNAPYLDNDYDFIKDIEKLTNYKKNHKNIVLEKASTNSKNMESNKTRIEEIKY